MTLLVIDVGSSSIRTLLFDQNAHPIQGAIARRVHQFTLEPEGAAMLDMYEVQQLVEACIDEVLQHPQAQHIQAVGMATLVGNLLGIDQKGHLVTPVYTYADTRSADDVESLRTKINPRETHQRTGCMHHTAYHPARLHWLRRTDPKLFAQVSTWTDIATTLYATWFGKAACSYSVASWSGLLNRHTADWDSEWLILLGLEKSQFSPLADYSDACQGLTETYARRWPVLRDVPFFLAVGDGVAANVGSGCVQADRIALTVGTTAAIRLITPASVQLPYGLWSYRVDHALHLIGGATSEGGNIFQWISEMFGLEHIEGLEATLAKKQPDSHGLTFLPLLAGERSPGWATNATGAITGLRLSTEPVEILQAALEGVALRLSLIAEPLLPLAAPNAEFVASGGAITSSPAWLQIVANAINCPLHLTNVSEITARGVAILMLRALGQGKLHDFPPTVVKTFTPEPTAVEVLHAARARQVSLYNKLIADTMPLQP